MLVSAHQPNHLPWCGYFDKILRSDLFVLFDDVQYDPNDYINRNKIKTAQGWQWLTVPVLHKGYQQKGLRIKDVEIDNKHNWIRKHLRAITLNYQRAPYFDTYFPGLRDILCEMDSIDVTVLGDRFPREIKQSRWNLLAELNETLIRWLCNALGIETRIVKASDYQFEGQKSGLVLDMSLQLGATEYLFGEQGENYCDKEAFMKAGVTPLFQKYRAKPYRQLHGEWLPNMSAIDVLMNEGPGSLDIIKGGSDGRLD